MLSIKGVRAILIFTHTFDFHCPFSKKQTNKTNFEKNSLYHHILITLFMRQDI